MCLWFSKVHRSSFDLNMLGARKLEPNGNHLFERRCLDQSCSVSKRFRFRNPLTWINNRKYHMTRIMRYVVGGCYLSCLALNLLCFILKFTTYNLYLYLHACFCNATNSVRIFIVPSVFWVWFILVLGLRAEGSEPETDKFMVAEVNLEFSCVCFIEWFSKQRRMVRFGRVTELLTYSYSYSNQASVVPSSAWILSKIRWKHHQHHQKYARSPVIHRVEWWNGKNVEQNYQKLNEKEE